MGNTLIMQKRRFFFLSFFSSDSELLEFVATAEYAERQKQEFCEVLEKHTGNRFIDIIGKG